MELDQQLQLDAHDLAIEEKMEIINTCYTKTVGSIISSIPDLDELLTFRKCVRKYARVKMRCINYYHNGIHTEHDKDGKPIKEDYLLSSLKRSRDISLKNDNFL